MSFSESCRQVRGNSQWTVNGLGRASLKSSLRVDADGNLDRYLQECMMVHD